MEFHRFKWLVECHTLTTQWNHNEEKWKCAEIIQNAIMLMLSLLFESGYVNLNNGIAFQHLWRLLDRWNIYHNTQKPYTCINWAQQRLHSCHIGCRVLVKAKVNFIRKQLHITLSSLILSIYPEHSLVAVFSHSNFHISIQLYRLNIIIMRIHKILC